MPSCKEIFSGNAGCVWNVICCPIVAPIYLIWKSFMVYVGPCVRVLGQRCVVGCVWRYLFPCCFVYEDKDFFGSKAVGTGDAVTWVRAQDLDGIRGKRPQLFEGEIEPNDLCQGAVGDCWLVAAFACASEFPHVIRRMFLTREYNPRGRYRVKIYDPQAEKFVVVTVDDRIPCKPGTRQPMFMSPNGNELWAIMLEKAFAKFCGSYQNLNGGFTLWGWQSMTGDKVFQMSLQTSGKKRGWKREDMVAIQDKKDKRACGFRGTSELYSNDQLWTLLKKYDQQLALMSASIGKSDDRKTDGPAGEQMLKKEGLVAGHAYSLIQAVEVQGFKLLQLRNPWGTFEWKGDWSDKSKMWRKHPSVKKAVGFVDADDGAFWMSFDDFVGVYTRVNVCDRTTAHDWSLDVNEDKGSCGIVSGFISGCCTYWCCCRGFINLYFGHQTTDETLSAEEKCCCMV